MDKKDIGACSAEQNYSRFHTTSRLRVILVLRFFPHSIYTNLSNTSLQSPSVKV